MTAGSGANRDTDCRLLSRVTETYTTLRVLRFEYFRETGMTAALPNGTTSNSYPRSCIIKLFENVIVRGNAACTFFSLFCSLALSYGGVTRIRDGNKYASEKFDTHTQKKNYKPQHVYDRQQSYLHAGMRKISSFFCFYTAVIVFSFQYNIYKIVYIYK